MCFAWITRQVCSQQIVCSKPPICADVNNCKASETATILMLAIMSKADLVYSCYVDLEIGCEVRAYSRLSAASPAICADGETCNASETAT